MTDSAAVRVCGLSGRYCRSHVSQRDKRLIIRLNTNSGPDQKLWGRHHDFTHLMWL